MKLMLQSLNATVKELMQAFEVYKYDCFGHVLFRLGNKRSFLWGDVSENARLRELE